MKFHNNNIMINVGSLVLNVLHEVFIDGLLTQTVILHKLTSQCKTYLW